MTKTLSAASAASFDHDNDGKPGGSKPAAETAAADTQTDPAPEPPPIPEGFVRATVTKHGAGRVHTGGAPGETFPRGGEMIVPVETAQALEAAGWVEAD